jgi:glycosyltransferase involved in cell wall biosynthesis
MGGSSTASFDLFARMLRDGRDAHYLNLIAEDPAYLASTFGATLGNPHGLSNVHNYWLDGAEENPQPGFADLVGRVRPDIVLGFGFPAALFFKRNIPGVRTVLMTGSCRQAAAYVTTGRAKDATDLVGRLAAMKTEPRIIMPSERLAVEKCDLIITHSESTHRFMSQFFPEFAGKIYPRIVSYAEWIAEAATEWCALAQPFGDRDIDALFISNDWDRPEKNYRMVEAIAARLGGRSVHVIGDVPREVKGATHHGFVAERADLFGILGRARCVVSPSLIDAAPGVLFEGSVMGCNLIASTNCGNADLCHADLRVDDYTAEAFVTRIERGVHSKYCDSLQACLARGSYRDLLATLDAFANPFESRGAA